MVTEHQETQEGQGDQGAREEHVHRGEHPRWYIHESPDVWKCYPCDPTHPLDSKEPTRGLGGAE